MERKMIDPEVVYFIEKFYLPVNPELKRFREESEAAHIPIIRRETETFLHTLLSLKQPSDILEIGSAVGYSSAFFSYICPYAHITTLEKDPSMAKKAEKNIEELGLSSRIKVIQGDARESILTLDTDFDFVFIDASKSHYKEFWDASIKKIRSGAMIVCDNILMSGRTVSDRYDPEGKYRTSIKKMREFLKYINNDESMLTSFLTSADGISVSVVRS